MQQSYYSVTGIVCQPQDLKIPLARDLVLLLTAGLEWFRLIECRSSSSKQHGAIEMVVFEAEPEITQYRANDIRGVERIASVFVGDELPNTQALRTDFPAIPHINPYENEFPRSLCLWEEPPAELRLRWTSAGYLYRVRDWLRLSALNELHLPGQSLEPLLPNLPLRLIVPRSLLVVGDVTPDVISASILRNDKWLTVTANWRTAERDGVAQSHKTEHTFVVLEGQPQQHGLIRRLPQDLAELHEFALTAGIDLKSELRSRIRKWQRNQKVLNSHLILILLLPKRRSEDGPIETIEERAFVVVKKTILEIAKDLGFRSTGTGSAAITYALDKPNQGRDFPIVPMNVTPMLNRESAASFNGHSQGDDVPIVGIGAGALGSQLMLNLVRGGFGDWTIVDNDILLPHNMARHAFFGPLIGHSKSVFVAHLCNEMFDETLKVRSIDVDVMAPGKEGSRLHKAFAEANIILDMSASVAVAHYLSHDLKVSARRVAAFLNPNGSDLVVLSEDHERRLTIADLRIQHLRAVMRKELWPDHWQHKEERLRYARSCGDLSSQIPQDAVATHAATGSRAIRRLQDDEQASITVWRLDADSDSLERREITPASVTVVQCGRWQVRIADDVIETIHQLRSKKLPVETGGVLLGGFDTQRSIVTIVDVLPSPTDSVECRDSYIRGSQDLRGQVEAVQKVTGQHISYAGEWHSHPRGHNASPSSKDRQLFDFLSEDRQSDGLPAIMLIAAENGECRYFVEEMPDEGRAQ